MASDQISIAFVIGGRSFGTGTAKAIVVAELLPAELGEKVSDDAEDANSTLVSANQTTSGERKDGVPILFRRSESGKRVASSRASCVPSSVFIRWIGSEK